MSLIMVWLYSPPVLRTRQPRRVRSLTLAHRFLHRSLIPRAEVNRVVRIRYISALDLSQRFHLSLNTCPERKAVLIGLLGSALHFFAPVLFVFVLASFEQRAPRLRFSWVKRFDRISVSINQGMYVNRVSSSLDSLRSLS